MRKGILVVALCGSTIALVALGFIEIQNRRADAQKSNARGRLSGLRHVMMNYEKIQGHRLMRVREEKGGRSIGWREEIAPYFDDQMMYAIKADPNRAEEFRRTLSTQSTPLNLRLPSDTSAPEFTSLAGVYDDADATESAPWAIAAIRHTGIAWKGTRDLTIQEFVRLLENPDEQKWPLAILTANGDVGRIDNTSVRFPLFPHDQRSVKTLLLRP